MPAQLEAAFDAATNPRRSVSASPQRSLKWRVFWRGLPWTAAVVIVYIAQIVTSIFMEGEWATSLVVLQAVVVAAFVAIFYALALAREKEQMEPT